MIIVIAGTPKSIYYATRILYIGQKRANDIIYLMICFALVALGVRESTTGGGGIVFDGEGVNKSTTRR